MSNYQLKIHVEKPGTTFTDPQSGQTHLSSEGHVWYEVIKPDGTTIVQAGFAPVDQKTTVAPVLGEVKRTDGSAYAGDSYFTAAYNITANQADMLGNYAKDPTQYGFSLTYWAGSNSCVDYVWEGLSVIGMNPSGYEGALLPMDNIARFSTLSNTGFANNGLVKLEKTTNSIGSSFVSGFASTQTSMDGVNWSKSIYSFDTASAATNADHAAWEEIGRAHV